MRTGIFEPGVDFAALTDIGAFRKTNEDKVISCPEYGFFAVSDGMGGLPSGGQTSEMVARVLPGMAKQMSSELKGKESIEEAAGLLSEQVKLISDNIYEAGNKYGRASFGATLCCVWFVDEYAVFVNLGDSRGYLLPYSKWHLSQITEDHNVAAMLVAQGELTKEEAKNHPSSSRLTRFVGMDAPAKPEVFIKRVKAGDRILLCSDGLYGMVENSSIKSILRSSKKPAKVCGRLISKANENGGRDNISAIYIKCTRQ